MSSEEGNYTLPDLDEVIKFIGKGGYGKVNLILQDYQIFARKEVAYDLKNIQNVDRTIGEIEVLKGLKHKNIVELKDSYIDLDKKIIYIYTKYYEKGDLWKVIDDKKKKKESFSFVVYLL